MLPVERYAVSLARLKYAKADGRRAGSRANKSSAAVHTRDRGDDCQPKPVVVVAVLTGPIDSIEAVEQARQMFGANRCLDRMCDVHRARGQLCRAGWEVAQRDGRRDRFGRRFEAAVVL